MRDLIVKEVIIMNGSSKTVFSIFGGTGDLTHRKLLPALFDLFVLEEISGENFQLLIIGRRDYTSEVYREQAKISIEKYARFKKKNEVYDQFLSLITYVDVDYTKPEDYLKLKEAIKSHGCRYLFYLAVAPGSFSIIANNLKQSGIIDDACEKQLLIEKPFGDDLESAIRINEELKQVFREEEIYRIDHYLAKEMIINILTIRFTNQVFKSLWNKESIENIQISVTEQVGVGDRGGYYDESGALKDMFQSHLIQMLTYVLMDEPKSMQSQDIHEAQEKVIEYLELAQTDRFKDSYVRGQYLENKDSLGYLQENRIDPKSETETFVAMELRSKNPNLKGVPIYVRTGKRMEKQETVVAITFKNPQGFMAQEAPQNVLIIRVGPDEGIYFKVNIKRPGNYDEIQSVTMDFCQSCIYENRLNTPQAYERILMMALRKDSTLFTSWKMAKQSWELTEEIQKRSQIANIPLTNYLAYTQGPIKAWEILQKNGHEWYTEDIFINQ